jgi:hypothetical protein
MSHSQPDQERRIFMKSFPLLLALTVVPASVLAQSLPSGHPMMGAAKEGKPSPEAQLPQKAKVLSTIDAAGYTYLEVTQNKKTVWLAGPKVVAKKGDIIRFDDGMVMTNFESKTLKRTFPSVTFVNMVVVSKEKE